MQVAETRPQSIVSIQVLRAFAALGVAIAHFHHEFIEVPGGIGFGAGGLGVDLFFVISGFIMVHTCWDIFGQRRAPINFFLRRIVRIVPVYWAASLITLGCVLYTQPISRADLSVSSILASFVFFPMTRPGGSFNPLLTVGWTLNFEMLFYTIFAISLYCKRQIAITLSISVLVLLANLHGVHAFQALTFWARPTVLEFALGMLIAVIYRNGLKMNQSLAAMSIATGSCVVIAYYVMRAYNIPLGLPAERAYSVGPGMGLVLIGAVFADWKLGGYVWRKLSRLGDVSYGIYIIHPILLWPHVILGMHGLALPVKNIFYFLLLIVLTVSIAIASYRFFERPLTSSLNKIIYRHFPVVSRRITSTTTVSGVSSFSTASAVSKEFPMLISCIALSLVLYVAFVFYKNKFALTEASHSVGMNYLLTARDLQAKKQYQNAIENFTHAIDIEPNIGMPGLIYVERGMAYESMGDYNNAYRDYSSGIAINPDKFFLLRRIHVAKFLGERTSVAADLELLAKCCSSDPEVLALLNHADTSPAQ